MYEFESTEKCALRYVQNVGRAEQIMKEALRNPLFIDLSKHNTYWHSEHDAESVKLNTIRCGLQDLESDICRMLSLIDPQEE